MPRSSGGPAEVDIAQRPSAAPPGPKAGEEIFASPEIQATLKRLEMARERLLSAAIAFCDGSISAGQLKAVRELAAIQAGEDVPITSHGVPYTSATSPALRADAAVVCPDAQAILDQAPEVEERYIVVPDIPGTELE